ncbi:MAG: transposase [Microcystis sp. LE19-131.1A]|uniref:NF041680 family putative transposase n=1 Tax=Microcystis sp. LE19-131.1A TaxID=3016439 RepID=UPI0022BFFBB7|nr:NF041680 family putative transposase [Microcystis sp. LE19-131.1A]MCZ8240583.1 transposase [Microcystis sp. LE19-131.1A]
MNQSTQKLQDFRNEVYQLLGPAKDSTFELMDAILVTKNVYSLVELSLSPVFRRKWSSLYEALDDCRPKTNKLMKLYISEIPSSEPSQRIILAGDHTPWPRTEAPTLKDRTYEHGAKVISGKPITLGHGYSTLAWIPKEKGSWALPLRHERITSHETPITRAVLQLKQVCRHLEERPITLWDSEYGCANFVKLTSEINADKLMRLRPNRCVFAKAPAYQGKGRPKKHGHKMKLSAPITWAIPIESIEINDSTWGVVKIQKWSQFHFYESAEHPMEIILIQRQGKGLSQKEAKPMWLAWIGTEQPSLMSLWSLYLKRFAIEHWNRFVKQRLHWTKAKLGNTESGQRWSNLMPILTWQLWLAREMIEDNPLPWQKPQPLEKLTPGRVAQGFAGLLAVIGTPAKPPKPRGKSPGWEKGKKRKKKPRYPVVKKTVTRQKKDKKEAD